jgi:UDP-glucose 4-epimerase
MMNILVTGGAGYIGSVCSAQLIKLGHSVVVVDDLSTGFEESIPDGVKFFKTDIKNGQTIRGILRENPVDAVFHFAAKALIPESMSNPGLFFNENVASGIALLEELRHMGIRKFIFSSSAAVYGNPETVPIVEDARKDPVNSYGETKLMFERILSWYSRAYGWGIAALRYFNACGAAGELGERHHPETHIIPLLLQAALRERKDFTIYGDDYPTPDGTCLRDYVHVLDIADAHILAMQDLASPGMHIYNIGTGKSRSVHEVVGIAERVTGVRIPVRVSEKRPGDPAILCASPLKLMQRLGWRPNHSDLDEIVKSAWDFQVNSKKVFSR